MVSVSFIASVVSFLVKFIMKERKTEGSLLMREYQWAKPSF